MTDNPDNEGFNLDESFDNLGDKKSTLGDMWRDKPLFKVGVVVAAAIAIFGTIILFGSSGNEKPVISMVPAGAEITAPPGTEEASPAYIEAVKEQNQARTEEAERTGTSSFPTPIEPPVGRVALAEEQTGGIDPLQRWRKLQEERLERELQRSQTLTPASFPEEDANRQAAVAELAQTMVQQMQAILDSRNQIKVNYRSITDPSYLDDLREKEEKVAAAAAAAAQKPGVDIQEIIFPAGQIAYAQLITEANSDAPGPVLAQIAGGPLNGARLLGRFEVKDDLLTLNFDTIVLEGISYDIDAVALDPETTLPAMATDVDHHYFKKIVLPAAAAFVEGVATAISESGRTSITVSGESVASSTEETDSDQEVASGIEEAGREVGEIMDELAEETETTVIIESGTQIGVLFIEPVIKEGNETQYNSSGLGSAGTVNALKQEVANTNAKQ